MASGIDRPPRGTGAGGVRDPVDGFARFRRGRNSERRPVGGQETGEQGAAGQRGDAVQARIETLAGPVLEGMGIQLVDVEYRYEGRWVLRILIDRPDGVTLDDCSTASRALSALLDEHDPIPNEYSLEVSSPGLFRPLRAPKHFRQAVGKIAKLSLAPEVLPERKNRQVRGTIAGAGERGVILDVGGEQLELPYTAVRRAKLDPDL